MRTMCSRQIFTKKCRQQPIFDSDLKGAWHYNHVTFTPIAKNFMLYCKLIYILSILCVRLTIKVKVGIPESFKVGWYPPKKTGRVILSQQNVQNARKKISWLFYAFSICFVSFYIIFVKVEFFHVNLRGNVVFTTSAIRIYFAPLTLILYTYFN